MPVLRETRTVTLSRTPERTVEARVRVRGLDLRARGYTVHVERQTPAEVIVTQANGERRHSMPGRPTIGLVAAALAAPMIARAIARAMKPRRSN